MQTGQGLGVTDRPITEPVTYRKPFAALLDGREVRVMAHGNQEGKSPVFQYCDEQTGEVRWESQNRFKVIDSNILPAQSIRKILSGTTPNTTR